MSEIIPEIDRVILLRDGRILADGLKSDVLTETNLRELFGVHVKMHAHNGSFHIY